LVIVLPFLTGQFQGGTLSLPWQIKHRRIIEIMQEEKKNLLWLRSRTGKSNADDIICMHFISVEALQRIAYCVLRIA